MHRTNLERTFFDAARSLRFAGPCHRVALSKAVEDLLASGFAPRRTVFLLFGHDEEVGGDAGAKQIAAHLAKRGVTLEFLLGARASPRVRALRGRRATGEWEVASTRTPVLLLLLLLLLLIPVLRLALSGRTAVVAAIPRRPVLVRARWGAGGLSVRRLQTRGSS